MGVKSARWFPIVLSSFAWILVVNGVFSHFGLRSVPCAVYLYLAALFVVIIGYNALVGFMCWAITRHLAIREAARHEANR